jgi:hypothetical protein
MSESESGKQNIPREALLFLAAIVVLAMLFIGAVKRSSHHQFGRNDAPAEAPR